LIGGPGSSIHPSLFESLIKWEKHPGMATKVTKGSNYLTEHYSAVRAEVEDPGDTGTMLNTKLIGTLEKADIIAIGGQASTHCVANTVTDIANEFGDDAVKRIVILEDAMSPVPGFENLYSNFEHDMKSRGVKFDTTDKFLS
jgi:nicotinamidase-related amidase